MHNFLAQDKTGAVNDALDSGIDLRLDAGILSFQINERYLNWRNSFDANDGYKFYLEILTGVEMPVSV